MSYQSYHKVTKVAVVAGGMIGGFCLLTATLITFFEVCARYIFNSPTTWSLDYSMYLVMWGTFMGAGYTMMCRGHISVDVVVKKLRKSRRLQLKIATLTLLLVFCGILAWCALIACIEAYKYMEITLSYTQTPLYIPIAAICIGAVLLMLELISQIIETKQTKERP